MVSLILMAVFQFFMALIIKRIVISAGTDENFIGYLSYTPSLNILLQALTIVIAATIVSMEFDKKTIKFLLIRPVKRQKGFLVKINHSRDGQLLFVSGILHFGIIIRSRLFRHIRERGIKDIADQHLGADRLKLA